MPYRADFSAQAKRDLDSIFRYIDAVHSEAAARWFNGLEEALQSLSEMPQRSPRTPERPGLYQLLYGNKPHIYRAIYSIREDQNRVLIVAIRHGARAPLISSQVPHS